MSSRDVIKIQRRGATGLEDVLTLGDIVETGSNANGEYVRWSDGTQICRSTIILTNINKPEKETIWDSNSYTSPASFSGDYDVFISYAWAQNGDINIYPAYCFFHGKVLVWNTGRSPANVHPGDAIRGTSGGSYNVTSAEIRVVAIGKWK